VATVAVEAAPHVRSIGFFPSLRYAIVVPVCFCVALAATVLYHFLQKRFRYAGFTLAATILVAALVALLDITAFGPNGMVMAALPALLSVALVIALLVPAFVDRPRRSIVGTVSIVIFGVLELTGLAGALSTEGIVGAPTKINFEVPPSLFNVEQRFVDLPSGAHIHYVDEGHGPTILFLHGNPSWLFQWRDLITGLRGSYRCVALDYPGFGMSTAPAGFGYMPLEESRVVEEFVDRLGLQKVTLVMQDWGGPIGIGLAERRPDLIQGMILGSTWAWQTSKNEPRGKFSSIFGGPIGEFIQMNFPGIVAFGLKLDVVRQLSPDITALYLRPFIPPARRGIAAFYPGQITQATQYFAQLERGLPRLANKNALIFWALKDPGFSDKDLARWEESFPRHRTIQFPNASHFFFEDEWREMIPAIQAYMSSEQIQETGAPVKSP